MVKPTSRIGFQYSPSSEGFSDADLDGWLRQLESLDAAWLYICGTSERAIPGAFLKGLLDEGIEPIVHLLCQVGEFRPAELNPLLYSYAHWGVSYVVVHDRPNMKDGWAGDGWARRGLVDRYLDAVLPTLQAQHSAGLIPVFAPLEPGGDYWDTAFLESALKGLARRGQRELLESLTLTCYAWSQGRPPNWGAGGPQAWPAARPYGNPEGTQDHRGFRIFEWYTDIASRAVGAELPIIALGAGSREAGPAHEEANRQIAQILRLPERAAGLVAACFESLPSEAARQPWLKGSRIQDKPRHLGKQAPGTSKTVSHYLLLPAEEGRAIPAWRRATAFALTHRPVVGFSPREAAMAEQVTIAAGPEVISSEVEERLRTAGCRVQRLSLMPSRKSACNRPISQDSQPTSDPR